MLEIPEVLRFATWFTSEETLRTYVGIEELFDKLSYVDHLHQIDEVMDIPNGTGAGYAQSLLSTYRDHLSLVAREFGITFSDENSLNVELAIISAVHDLGDPFLAQSLTVSEPDIDDPLYLFAQYIAEITNLTMHQVLTAFGVVDTALVNKFNVILSESTDDDDLAHELSDLCRLRLKRWYGDQREGITYEFLKDIKTFPYGLAYAKSVLVPKLQESVQHIDVKREICAMVLGSTTPNVSVVDEATDLLYDVVGADSYTLHGPSLSNLLREYV